MDKVSTEQNETGERVREKDLRINMKMMPQVGERGKRENPHN